MKTDVEELSPTRVRLSVEVPFDELKPSLDKAYREVGRQVRIKGFRPGRVPPPVIDRHVGREAVLSQAVNDAIPDLYAKAVAEGDIYALGQPEVEITRIDDGKELAFTVEVDIRPKFELPDLSSLAVTVDDTLVTPDEVAERLAMLQDRFASLKGVSRPVQEGDHVSIDLSASVDGKPVDDAQASGLSYPVGSESLLDGLDQTLIGMSAGDSATFKSELAGGEFAGHEADVTVTVHSVKAKEVPGLDDDFAQMASEFDTLGELRADTRAQLERDKAMQQVIQARDLALNALLDQVDVPLPESVVTDEAEHNRESILNQLSRAGASLDGYLEMTNQSEPGRALRVRDQAGRADGRGARPAGPAARRQRPAQPRGRRGAARQGHERDRRAGQGHRQVGEPGRHRDRPQRPPGVRPRGLTAAPLGTHAAYHPSPHTARMPGCASSEQGPALDYRVRWRRYGPVNDTRRNWSR